MAGSKGQTAGAVPSRAGYCISRIEAPAPVENLRSNNAGSGDRRGCASSEMEARNEQHQHPARSRGGGRSGSKHSGKGRRGKRGGGEYQESVSSGAGTISARKDCSDRSVTFSKSGDCDRAVSSRRRNHQQQPRGGGPRKNQTHVQKSSQTHVNTTQIRDLPSSYLALPQDGHLRRGRLHDVELRGTSRGFPRAPREERQQVGRLHGSGRDGEGSRETTNAGASSPIGRERQTAARVDPYEGQMLRQSVGHQAHSSESSPRPASDVGEGISSKAGISGTRYSKASSSQHAKGTCMSMCPVGEARSREAEGALSVFEATDATAMLPFRQRVADPNRTVKKYRRSAAGRDMHSPEQLRPLEVLQMTARYLVEVIFANTCVKDGVDSASREIMTTNGIRHRGSSNTLKAYLFVEDRLRAVRQDMTVQGIALTAGAAEVLKTTANFYIVSEYLLCDEPADVFDRHLHTRELQGVFSSLAELFFQARGYLCPREAPTMVGLDEYLCLQAVHALVTAVHNCHKEDTSIEAAARGKGVGRVFTTTVSKLCVSSYGYGVGKGMVGAMSGGRLMPLDGPFRKTFPKMAAAIRLLGAVGVGDWSEFHRILGRYPVNHAVEPLVGDEDAGSAFAVRLRCLCHGMLLPLRVHAVRVMNRSFAKGERVPLADLKRTLRMRDDAHAAGLCRALSLPIQDETVTFKSVPAVWKTQHDKNKGYLPPPRTAEYDWPANSMREDDWVGLDSVLEMTNVRGFSTARGRGCFGAVPLCEGCGGHGCSWCTEGDTSEGGGEGRQLWEAALVPG